MANGVTPGLLEQAELFRGIGVEGLAAATGCASRLSLRAGAQLLKQGDPPLHVFMLEHGRIKMSVVSPDPPIAGSLAVSGKSAGSKDCVVGLSGLEPPIRPLC
jgi:hypothetical protein